MAWSTVGVSVSDISSGLLNHFTGVSLEQHPSDISKFTSLLTCLTLKFPSLCNVNLPALGQTGFPSLNCYCVRNLLLLSLLPVCCFSQL